jgi:transcriptional regulator with XRE-family HTH domain
LRLTCNRSITVLSGSCRSLPDAGPSALFIVIDKARTIMKILDHVLNPREIRRRLGLNQEQFWTRIGVTQSGGSRYESGRDMPRPVKELLRLVHVEQLDLSQIKRVDFEIIDYLKTAHPDLYRSLRRAVKNRDRHGVEAGIGSGVRPFSDGEGTTLGGVGLSASGYDPSSDP